MPLSRIIQTTSTSSIRSQPELRIFDFRRFLFLTLIWNVKNELFINDLLWSTNWTTVIYFDQLIRARWSGEFTWDCRRSTARAPRTRGPSQCNNRSAVVHSRAYRSAWTCVPHWRDRWALCGEQCFSVSSLPPESEIFIIFSFFLSVSTKFSLSLLLFYSFWHWKFSLWGEWYKIITRLRFNLS